MKRIIIFANGELPDLEKARSLLQSDDYTICADGGTRHALALGVTPDLIIGDMDSVEKGQLQKLQDAEVSMELFPHDKNETDLELAIQRAVEMNPAQVIISYPCYYYPLKKRAPAGLLPRPMPPKRITLQ